MNCAEKKTRIRGENWSQREKDIFTEVMRDASSVLESKETDTNTNHEKKLEWAKIQKKLNELSGVHRDIPQIKNYWTRTKAAAKEVSEHRKTVCDTDGDQKPSPDNTSKAAVVVEENRKLKRRAIALMEEEYSLKLQFQRQEITHQKLKHTLEIELLYLEKEKKLLQIEDSQYFICQLVDSLSGTYQEVVKQALSIKMSIYTSICMEALCAQRDMTVENTITVLLSLVTLLDAPENRARLLKDKALAIELCQIIHRTGLTLDSVEALVLVADVVALVLRGARDQLTAAMHAKIRELAPDESPENIPQSVLEVVHTLGEGGPTGDLPPGKSLVFACLEVCVCLLVRRLPRLSPMKQEGTVGVIGVKKGLGVHGDTLLVKTLGCMAELTTLTSPQGALSVLPTLLYLGTEVLSGGPVAAEGGVALLERCGGCSAARLLPHTRAQHDRLLQATLAKLVERVKCEEADQRLDSVVGARAMAAVLRHAPLTAALHYPAVNHLRQCLDTADNEVFAECCNVVGALWSGGAALWARALGARVLARAASARAPVDAAHVRAAIAAVGALDRLVDAVPDSERIQLLWMLVPIVIGYLREGSAPAHARALHDFALAWLMRVGPRYPQEFKTMMQQSSELRMKLEGAVKASQSARAPRPQRPAYTRPQPTIQLKTDFSDFR